MNILSSRPYGASDSADAHVGAGTTDSTMSPILAVAPKPGVAQVAVAATLYSAAALAFGYFAYSLFRGPMGGLGFKDNHPVWGTLFGLSAVSSAVGAGNTILGVQKQTY